MVRQPGRAIVQRFRQFAQRPVSPRREPIGRHFVVHANAREFCIRFPRIASLRLPAQIVALYFQPIFNCCSFTTVCENFTSQHEQCWNLSFIKRSLPGGGLGVSDRCRLLCLPTVARDSETGGALNERTRCDHSYL
jgi:hypothetical protein